MLVSLALVAALATSFGASSHAVPQAPVRIVSLVPAVTEMLVAMGAGNRLVGVGSFDRVPPALDHLPRVGALLDPDVERIISLRPDLVVVYHTQDDLRRQLARAGFPMFPYEHAGLRDVTQTIRDLGRRAGLAGEAAELASRIERDLDRIRRQVRGRRRPKTMLVFGRESMSLRNIDASGGVGFLHDMLATAGGDNVLADVAKQAVRVSSELLLARAPEVIVELRLDGGALTTARVAREMAAWRIAAAVPAVRSGRIYIFEGQEVVVPGPRVADGTLRIARALHPRAFTP